MTPTPSSPSKLVARLQQDPVIAKILLSANGCIVDPKLTRDLTNYFITSRDLANPGHYSYGVSPSFRNPPQDLRNCLTAVLKIQAFRDRVCEIQVNLLETKRRLDSAFSLGNRHIYEMWPLEVKARGTDTVQKAFIQSVLHAVYKRKELVVKQLEQVYAVLDNLDKAHFSYKAVAEIGIKLIDRLEGGRNVTSRA
jgi:hypothetical protein